MNQPQLDLLFILKELCLSKCIFSQSRHTFVLYFNLVHNLLLLPKLYFTLSVEVLVESNRFIVNLLMQEFINSIIIKVLLPCLLFLHVPPTLPLWRTVILTLLCYCLLCSSSFSGQVKEQVAGPTVFDRNDSQTNVPFISGLQRDYNESQNHQVNCVHVNECIHFAFSVGY